MKTLITILFLATFIQITRCQESEPSEYGSLKNELSFGLFGAGELQNFGYIVPGIGYKRYLKSGGIRILAGGNISSQTSNGNGAPYSGEEIAYVARVGYQHHVMLGRFMPMMGLDVFGGQWINSYNNPSNKGSSQNTVLGWSPTIGIQFWVSPKISVKTDMRVDVGYKETINKSTYQDWVTGTDITTTNRTTGVNTHVAPISSFMVAFHF